MTDSLKSKVFGLDGKVDGLVQKVDMILGELREERQERKEACKAHEQRFGLLQTNIDSLSRLCKYTAAIGAAVGGMVVYFREEVKRHIFGG
jgi:hypothetical protein